jgi:hypothetical protein
MMQNSRPSPIKVIEMYAVARRIRNSLPQLRHGQRLPQIACQLIKSLALTCTQHTGHVRVSASTVRRSTVLLFGDSYGFSFMWLVLR